MASNIFNDDKDCAFHIGVQVKRIDALGKDYNTDLSIEPLLTSVAYLKLINVPTMFDIGCPQSDPSSENLILNMVDEKAFKIEKQEFLSRVRKFKVEKFEKFKSVLKATHTNLSVSETVIYPHGVVRSVNTKQSGFFSNLRSKPKADKQEESKS
jgi:hypothetical protein